MSNRSSPLIPMSSARASPSDRPFVPSIREENEAQALLEKENFDMKMRIYYLEESIRSGDNQSVGGGGFGFGGYNHNQRQIRSAAGGIDEDSTLRINELQLDLEEKKAELESRNLLLSKAKDAVTKMKQELEEMRKETDPQARQELLERINRLKAANEEMEKTRHEQVGELEAAVVESKQMVFTKEQELATLMTRNEQLELDLKHKEDRLSEAREEHDRDQQHILLVNTKCEKMEEELVQARAHVELYRLETEDHRKEAEKLMHQLREAEDMTHHQQELHDLRHSLEQQHALAIERIHGDHKIAMTELREELDNLHGQHKNDLHALTERHEVRERDMQSKHQIECNRIREELGSQKDEMRLEREREREDAAARLEEKLDEYRKLHSQMEHYRTKIDHMTKEIEAAKIAEEAAKVELSFNSDKFDNVASELASAKEQVREMKRAHEQAAIMKEELRRETNEKESYMVRMEQEKSELVHKLEHATEMYDKVRLAQHENEYMRTAAEAELKSMKAMQGTVEQVTRENEKYQHENTALSKALQDEKHAVMDLRRDVGEREKVLQEARVTIGTLSQEVEHMKRENDILIADSAKLSSLDSAINELRSSARSQEAASNAREEALRRENGAMKAQVLQAEGVKQEATTRYNTVTREYSVACVAVTESMGGWDTALTELLDGLPTYAPDYHGGAVPQFATGSQQSLLGGTNERLSMSQLGGAGASLSDEELHTSLLPAMGKLSERIKFKIERFGRIRNLFVSGYEKEVAKVMEKLDSANQKVAILASKAARADSEVQRIRATLSRDASIRQQKELEMETFRTETMSNHSRELQQAEETHQRLLLQVREAEAKAAEMRSSLDAEVASRTKEGDDWREQLARATEAHRQELKAALASEKATQKQLVDEHTMAHKDWSDKTNEQVRVIEMHQAQERDMEESIRLLKAQVEALQRDLADFAEAEQVVNELSARCEDVAEEKSRLHKQLGEETSRKEAIISDATRLEEELRAEIDRLVEEMGSMSRTYSEEVEGLRATISEQGQQMAADAREMEYLRARQITPELSQIIRDTKAIMTTVASDNQEVIHDSKGVKELVTDLHTLTGSHDVSSVQAFDGATGIAGRGEGADTTTASSAVRFDSASFDRTKSRRGPAPSVSSTSTFKDTIGSATMGSLNQTMSSYSVSGGRAQVQDAARSPPAASRPPESPIPSRFTSTLQSLPTPPSALSMKSIVSAYDDRSAAGGGGGATSQGSMLAQQRQQHLSMSSSLTGPGTFENVYAPGDKQSLAPTSDGLGVRFSNGVSGARFSSSPATKSHTMGGSFSLSARNTPGGGIATPGTASRQSVSRLQRLGGDIKALASKLDAINGGRR